ncbi:putative short-chain dehydrogenase [Arthrospira platensis NIES-46]|uniref:Short-chain dehydrogenase n=1 Tax=Limnospira platensis NIES-46 TaxID=1236695 RepID=A0A5M3T767_LIMPL|nr:SDR family NAD(P)-dependent oxidoreductase [Arthrospira platensis]GCE94472.1 putative short-chain dehydrogenase [Arthrospira platensis NIES-46]
MHILIVGANGGIGYGFVEMLLQDPAIDRIYGTYRRWESAQHLLNLASRYPQRLVCLSMDITQESDLVAALETISHQTRELDLVVNCVGILHGVGFQPEKSLRQINSDRLIEYFQVNSIGAVLLAKHLLPFFSSPRRHVFATISAKLGSIGDNHLGGWYGYRASKAALNMLMRTVAIEYSRKSPQTIVVMLHPGTTDTELSQPFQKNVTPEKLFSVNRTVQQLLDVINRLEISHSGQFLSWDGTNLPW